MGARGNPRGRLARDQCIPPGALMTGGLGKAMINGAAVPSTGSRSAPCWKRAVLKQRAVLAIRKGNGYSQRLFAKVTIEVTPQFLEQAKQQKGARRPRGALCANIRASDVAKYSSQPRGEAHAQRVTPFIISDMLAGCRRSPPARGAPHHHLGVAAARPREARLVMTWASPQPARERRASS